MPWNGRPVDNGMTGRDLIIFALFFAVIIFGLYRCGKSAQKDIQVIRDEERQRCEGLGGVYKIYEPKKGPVSTSCEVKGFK